MTHGIRYAEGLKILPLVAPVAFTTTAVASSYVDANMANWITFLVEFGAMTSDSSDTVTLTVECSSANTSDAAEVTLAYKYRLSEAVNTDSMGDITDATTAGAVFTATDDNKVVVIDVNPDTIPAALTDGRWLRVVATPTDAVASGVIAIQAILEPKYPGNAIPSST